jgi:type II secretory pathway pseudopilin PulG
MKNHKHMWGVTLLEIMLVLAIAAMIIVMSVRYYQSATSSQQANAILQQIQAIVAAADGLAQGNGSYSNCTSTNVKPLLPAAGLNTPWGTTITLSATASSITITIPKVPSGVCPLVVTKLSANNHYSSSATTATPFTLEACKGTGNLAVNYLASP